MLQEIISKIYKQFVRLAFNITIITLIIGLFVGIFRTVSELGLTITEATVRLGFKELVTNVLSLIIVLELIRAFTEFFEHERVRVAILLEVLIAFVIGEFMLHLFEGKLSGMDVFFWSLGIVALVGARAIGLFYSVPKG
ncbi:phosphate-starvation-inducible PsiE family protein [Thermocrinis sp.]|uniref:phosphate-starvation-inducible PsiE family protein n=1 Tax=Thermocrinis sp. TaxID=2024383 RepID=UPI003C076725